MPWIYRQSTGDLSYKGQVVDRGYSGAAIARNNPSLERLPAVGPIPRGTYRVGPPHDSRKTGPYTLDLTPIKGTNTYGRTAFKMHSDSITHPGNASEGCIVMHVHTRQRVWGSNDWELEMIP